MQKLTGMQEPSEWTLIAATDGTPTEEAFGCAGLDTEETATAHGTWETSARNAVERACGQDRRGSLAVRVWNGKGELTQVVLRAQERTSANMLR